MEPITITLGITCLFVSVAATGAIIYALNEQRHDHRREKAQLDRQLLETQMTMENKRFVLEHNAFIKKQKISGRQITHILAAAGTITGNAGIRTDPRSGIIEYAVDNRPHPIPATPHFMIAPSVIPPAISHETKSDPALIYSGKDFQRVEIRKV